MSNTEIIRAWKDVNYRTSLSEAALAMLPANPAGTIELSDPSLRGAAGQANSFRVKATVRAGAYSGRQSCA